MNDPDTRKIDAIIKPFTVLGNTVDSIQIANAIDLLANAPPSFTSGEVLRALLPDEKDFHTRYEAANRLFQRWRKMGLATFSKKNWTLTPGSWEIMQMAAHKARRSS